MKKLIFLSLQIFATFFARAENLSPVSDHQFQYSLSEEELRAISNSVIGMSYSNAFVDVGNQNNRLNSKELQKNLEEFKALLPKYTTMVAERNQFVLSVIADTQSWATLKADAASDDNTKKGFLKVFHEAEERKIKLNSIAQNFNKTVSEMISTASSLIPMIETIRNKASSTVTSNEAETLKAKIRYLRTVNSQFEKYLNYTYKLIADLPQKSGYNSDPKDSAKREEQFRWISNRRKEDSILTLSAINLVNSGVIGSIDSDCKETSQNAFLPYHKIEILESLISSTGKPLTIKCHLFPESIGVAVNLIQSVRGEITKDENFPKYKFVRLDKENNVLRIEYSYSVDSTSTYDGWTSYSTKSSMPNLFYYEWSESIFEKFSDY